MTLTKGQRYKKADFGIISPQHRLTDHIVGGELYSFFGVKMLNEIHADGFVYKVRKKYNLVPLNTLTDLCRHIFLQEAHRVPYTYIGKTRGEKQYSSKQNKALW